MIAQTARTTDASTNEGASGPVYNSPNGIPLENEPLLAQMLQAEKKKCMSTVNVTLDEQE